MGAGVQVSDRIGRRMKLHDLNVLMVVVQAGSMSKAAALLNTTQSAISRSIADLEQTIGARLLDRGPQGVEPTQYGRALLKRGVVAFDELKQGVQDIEFLSDPGAGELRVGSSPAMSEGIVLAVIEKLSRQYPRVVFHVAPGGAPALLDDLRARRIELGFAQMSGVAPEEDMHQDVLFEERLVVVAGMDSQWVRRRKIKLGELVNEPWTWPTAGTAFDARVVEAFRASGLKPPRATVYADAINMRTRLAANGRFLAVVPAYIMRFPAKHVSLKVLPVELPTTHRQIGIITLKNRMLSPLAQLFIDCARDIAKTLAKGQAPSGRAKNVSGRDSQTT
jgi:DNA-binding transcriptional LysR family regulator